MGTNNGNSIDIEIVLVIVAAILAYLFGRIQHKKEYKETLRQDIFGTLLSVDLPKVFLEFIQSPSSAIHFNNFSSKIKEINIKISILIIFKKKKYEIIKSVLEELDELIMFNEYHLIKNLNTPIKITEIKKIEKRKIEITEKLKELYVLLGIDDYSGVLYQGYLKTFLAKIKFQFK